MNKTMNETMNNSDSGEKPKKITWIQILRVVIQAAVAALTALGVTSCVTCF